MHVRLEYVVPEADGQEDGGHDGAVAAQHPVGHQEAGCGHPAIVDAKQQLQRVRLVDVAPGEAAAAAAVLLRDLYPTWGGQGS